jgi:hypothetical protein
MAFKGRKKFVIGGWNEGGRGREGGGRRKKLMKR